ncbi:MAG: chloride channel protein [Bacteroidales bacterium]|nr:chloride channel protein [Bacteroidales bacterium]
MQSFLFKLKKALNAILLWRLKHINDQQYIIIIAILVGLFSGLVAVLIKNTVHLVQWTLTFFFVSRYQNIMLLFYPMIGIGIVFLLIRFVFRRLPKAEIPDVLYAIHREKGKIKPSNTWITMILSSITVGFGGSVGLEGPSATAGASLGSAVAQFLRLNKKQTILLISCAGAGAIASLFKAPIAGVVFALEIFMLDLTMSSILPLLISATVGAITSYLFFGNDVLYDFHIVIKPSWSEIPFFIILGILTGVFSIYFIKIKEFSHKIFSRLDKHWKKWLLGGLSLGMMIFFMPPLFGEGYSTVNSCLHGDYSFLFLNSPFYDYKDSIYAVLLMFFSLIILKSFATFFTLEAGGIGGIFAPILFLGSSIGFFIAILLNLFGVYVVPSNFAMVAMAGMLSGVMFAPLTGIFLIAEVTNGYDLIIPLMIVSSASYGMVRMVFKHSIYNQSLAQKGILFGHNKTKNVLASMKVSDFLETNFLPVHPNDSLRKLTEIISKSSRNIYPVVDHEGMFLGLVFLDHIKHLIFKSEYYDTLKVSDLSYMPNGIVNLNDPMIEVIKIFHNTGNFNLPVLDKGKYVGFISRAQIFSAFQQEMDYLSDE